MNDDQSKKQLRLYYLSLLCASGLAHPKPEDRIKLPIPLDDRAIDLTGDPSPEPMPIAEYWMERGVWFHSPADLYHPATGLGRPAHLGPDTGRQALFLMCNGLVIGAQAMDQNGDWEALPVWPHLKRWLDRSWHHPPIKPRRPHPSEGQSASEKD